MRWPMPFLAALIVATNTGCAFRNYLEPSFGMTRHEDLSRPENPLRLRLSASNDALRERVAQVLRKSGLIQSSYAGEDGDIHVTHTALMDKSVYDRSGPGLHGQDFFSMEISISTGGRTVTRQYEHSILWYSPSAEKAEGLQEPLGYESEDVLLEQMLLRALRDFQREGVIPGGVTPKASH